MEGPKFLISSKVNSEGCSYNVQITLVKWKGYAFTEFDLELALSSISCTSFKDQTGSKLIIIISICYLGDTLHSLQVLVWEEVWKRQLALELSSRSHLPF